MTDLHRNSKSDTVLLLDASLADIFVDHGPDRTNIADQTTYIDESPSARSALTAPRNITIKLRMQTGWSGTLIELGDGGAYSWRISLSGDELSFSELGLLRVRVRVPGLSGVDSTILVSWSQRIESSSVVDDVAIANLDTDEWSFGQATHAATAVDATDTLTVAAQYGGASPYTGEINAVLAVYLGRRFHAVTEVQEDWIVETTPPAMTGRRRTPMLTAPSDELLISNQGQFAGPAYLWSLAATRQADSRCVTPLVNIVARYPYSETNAYAPVRYFRKAFDSTLLHMSSRYLEHVPLADPKASHARVRVHARIWNATTPGSVCSVYLRGYSLANIIPEEGKLPGPLVYYTTSTAVITAETSAGEWRDLGVCKLAREASGRSYFALAHSFGLDAGGAFEAQTSLRIDAITVEPFYLPAADDAFDLTE